MYNEITKALWDIALKHKDVLTLEEQHCIAAACAIVYDKYMEEYNLKLKTRELDQKERRFGE